MSETNKTTAARRLTSRFFRRITSISTPLGGIQWEPGPDHKEIVRQLLVYLEDRRILHVHEESDLREVARHHTRDRSDVSESVLAIRTQLTETLQRAQFGTPEEEILEGMREACRELLGRGPIRSKKATSFYVSRIGDLRIVFGVGVRALSTTFDLKLGRHMEALASKGERYLQSREA